jgi:hypothetical protein
MPVVNPELRSRVSPEGAMILDISSDEIITLNNVGGYIWERLQEGKTVDQIIGDVVTKTGHDPVVVGQDVREFVEQIAARHLVSL